MSLSIALAVHNEEKNIIRCLESVYDWVDEIVIVDGASTDKTIQTINEFVANFNQLKPIKTNSNQLKLILTNNPAMFHINKQKAIEACTKDWILQLDADEVVSKELREEILEVLKGQNSNVKTQNQNSKLKTEKPIITNSNQLEPIAYWIPRLNYFLGKPLRKGGQYPDYTIRLYRNGVARFPCETVHEQVKISDGRTPGVTGTGSPGVEEERQPIKTQIGFLKADLLHFPYPTFSEYLNKWHRYNTLEADKLKNKGVKPSVPLFIDYCMIKPIVWFLKTYFRHKGFMDGVPGFVFSFFSALRYCEIYLKLI